MKVLDIGRALTRLGEWAAGDGRRPRKPSVVNYLRRRGDRVTGSVAVTLVGAVAAASVVMGIAAPSLAPKLANVGAWLGSSEKGTVVHVNGLSGSPDGRVVLKNAQGHPLRVVQDGTAADVVDEATGQVSRIDHSQLAVTVSRETEKGVQVVASAGVAYMVHPTRGEVQRIDPSSLATMGPAIKLKAPLGQAELDGEGQLWVPEPATGQVVGIEKGGKRRAVTVGQPGDALRLTIANGTPVVTNGTSASVMVIGGGGVRLRMSLPSEMTSASATGLMVPATSDGPVVPVLSPTTGALALVDASRGSLTTVGLGVTGDQMAAPQVLGQRVYVPDETTGSLVVYDQAAGAFDKQVPVTGHAGRLEAFEQGGLLWVNDENSAAALVVHRDGSTHPIGKYKPDVPGPKPEVTPAPTTQAPVTPTTQVPVTPTTLVPVAPTTQVPVVPATPVPVQAPPAQPPPAAPPSPAPSQGTAPPSQWPTTAYHVSQNGSGPPEVSGSLIWYNRSVGVSGTMQSGPSCTSVVYTGYSSSGQQLARYQTASRCGSTAINQTLDASTTRGGIWKVDVELYIGGTRVGHQTYTRP